MICGCSYAFLSTRRRIVVEASHSLVNIITQTSPKGLAWIYLYSTRMRFPNGLARSAELINLFALSWKSTAMRLESNNEGAHSRCLVFCPDLNLAPSLLRDVPYATSLPASQARASCEGCGLVKLDNVSLLQHATVVISICILSTPMISQSCRGAAVSLRPTHASGHNTLRQWEYHSQENTRQKTLFTKVKTK